ncbi:MAG: hypothetical protein EB150_07105 [Nitrososphaeria archaeon]|nr:hypothetical protein [Nitrososphaeria archaeon]NDB51921.1 hypothetical protein [Nitrosopumilaceae archaeon]NDB88614.1 hypothetical protein [Nitrososphaerota archaeon]NDB90983.1 hypothetical protein [Nitrososphaerota archaeon]NDB92900.1 hypothetical protein [Nitrososphaeria archaeon]
MYIESRTTATIRAIRELISKFKRYSIDLLKNTGSFFLRKANPMLSKIELEANIGKASGPISKGSRSPLFTLATLLIKAGKTTETKLGIIIPRLERNTIVDTVLRSFLSIKLTEKCH